MNLLVMMQNAWGGWGTTTGVGLRRESRLLPARRQQPLWSTAPEI